MPLVPDRQIAPGLLGDAGHLLALVDRLAHELLGHHVQALLHRGDGHGGVQVQRQGNDDGLDAVAPGVGEQLLVAAVNLHATLRFAFALPAVAGHETRAGGHAVIAVEGAELVVGADVRDRLHLEEMGVQAPMSTLPSSPVPTTPTRTGEPIAFS